MTVFKDSASTYTGNMDILGSLTVEKALTVNGTITANGTPPGIVTSIAGNTGAFTLNATSGITNSTNNILLSQASASQFGAVKVDNTTITAAAGVISAVSSFPSSSPIHASLGSDVPLNNTANYFDGPSIAQGSAGTWWVSGTVTVTDTASAANIIAKLWDGTTVIASGETFNSNIFGFSILALSGYLVAPAGNLRISVRDISATTGKILFNQSGNSKDSTISAFRIA